MENSWTDFKWVTGPCPKGSYVLGKWWQGTLEGNKTEDGVILTSIRYKGKIPAVPKKYQEELWLQLPGVKLCGIRGAISFSTGTLTSYEKGFECPSGMEACSRHPVANSTTYCVVKENNDCPITDLRLLDLNSNSPILTDPSYTKVLSPLSTNQNSNTNTQYYIAYTKNGYTKSNTPLKSLQWQYGQPCSFTD